jgi:hypothetical protein
MRSVESWFGIHDEHKFERLGQRLLGSNAV